MARGRGGGNGYSYSVHHRFNSHHYHHYHQNNFQGSRRYFSTRQTPYATPSRPYECRQNSSSSSPMTVQARSAPSTSVSFTTATRTSSTQNNLPIIVRPSNEKDLLPNEVQIESNSCPCFQTPTYFSTREFAHYIYQYCSTHNSNFHYYLVSAPSNKDSNADQIKNTPVQK